MRKKLEEGKSIQVHFFFFVKVQASGDFNYLLNISKTATVIETVLI